MVDCESSTGQHFAEVLKRIANTKVLQELNIDIGKCVGTSTDGAANMQGQYTLFSEQSPTQIHIWCHRQSCTGRHNSQCCGKCITVFTA